MSENNTPEMATEEERELIYLTDEEGNDFPFELLDVIDYKDEQFAIFFPAEDSEEETDDDGEVVILKVIAQEDDSAEFVSIDDEKTLDAVFDIFMENLRKSFAISDEEIEALGGEHHCDCGDEHCCH
jgi:uncharacterized protein YrzB (UPF0473 family)